MRSAEFNAAIVTGGTGVVGYALVQLLISKNITVHLFVRDEQNIKCLEEFRDKLQVYEVPLGEYKNKLLYISADVFFHLAWEGTSKIDRHNEEIQLGNLRYIKHAVKMAKKSGCRKFIGIGSQAEFGHQTSPMGNHTIPNPHTYYGIAKLAAGYLSANYCKQENIDFNWVRIFSVFGLCDNKNTLMEYVLNQIHLNSVIQINNPDAIWDYMFNDDAAEALYLIAIKGLNGKTYSLGSGVGMRIEEFIKRILEITRSNVKVSKNITPFQVDGVSYLVADMNELENDVKYISSNAFEQSFLCYFNQIKIK
jgi:nucleoside-diphosphate-sugar epimerase